ncbi:hypothetical protein AAAC15_34665 [Pseudomonas aeruginosa]
MPSNMTKLEQSIIANARAELSAVLYFYRKTLGVITSAITMR